MSRLPATLEVLRMKNQNIIERIEDERDTNDGYWLYLRSGWQFEGSHIIHEFNVAAMCKTFNNRVTKYLAPVGELTLATLQEKTMQALEEIK